MSSSCPYAAPVYLDSENCVVGSWAKRERTIWKGCRRCIICLQDMSLQRAAQFECEARSVAVTAVVTLTYDDAHLPPLGRSVSSDFSGFVKRLRRRADYAGLEPFRYVGCMEFSPAPEYRQHWHALLFGFWDPGARKAGAKGGRASYDSPMVTKAWGKGHAYVQVLDGSGIYAYVTKHQSSLEFMALPEGFDKPSLCTSKGPGREFCDTYAGQLLRDGDLIAGDRRQSLPIYFRKRLKAKRPEDYAELVTRAEAAAATPFRVEARKPERLAARVEILKARGRAQKRRKC